MDYKHIAKTISDFINHVEQIDPYQEYAGKFDRVIRAVIMAYRWAIESIYDMDHR